MRSMVKHLLGATALIALSAGTALAADCEVTHWWTSGGEAAAVAEFAKAFNAIPGEKWVDGAIGGSGDTARPIISAASWAETRRVRRSSTPARTPTI